jgi:hypothetical protein
MLFIATAASIAECVMRVGTSIRFFFGWSKGITSWSYLVTLDAVDPYTEDEVVTMHQYNKEYRMDLSIILVFVAAPLTPAFGAMCENHACASRRTAFLVSAPFLSLESSPTKRIKLKQ